EVYVLDWGVAHLVEGSDVRRTSHTNFMAGSPGYMAPEQALGGQIDARTDVFAIGVLLYEILSGERPFLDMDIESIQLRALKAIDVPPSRRDPLRQTPGGFDPLVVACLAPDRASRPPSARFVADAIDQFLDGARARAEREKEADSHVREGTAAREKYEALDAEARSLRDAGGAKLAGMPRWESAERKDEAWKLLARSRNLAAEAARELAHAETAFTRALGRVAEHALARSGLAALYYRQFEAAEARADAEKMAQYLDLAREYDDGDLALELAGKGELSLALISPLPATVSLAKYEPHGLLFRLGEERALGDAPVESCLVGAGSYVVTTRTAAGQCRFPLLIGRARSHHVRLRAPAPGDIPEGMVHVPGGPSLGTGGRQSLPDFAIARFPVTFRDYARFLSALPKDERKKRIPRASEDFLLEDETGAWRLHAQYIEGDARTRVPPHRELDIPVSYVSWHDAAAYAAWLGKLTGKALRLPSEREWEKAVKGADGRVFPMGNQLDPSFAKLRESRAEASQPEPIGAFPLDESPYGVRDLAGGVGDWTSTTIDGSPIVHAEEGAETTDVREAVWCGGSWSTSVEITAMRFSQMLHHRVGWVGFRLALSLGNTEKTTEGSSLSVKAMRRR
ncbi:MAG: SUMF1/EgtB/PvdO family nonheme iron enzyme, partial [Polyangiaceae bacterium]